MRSIWSISLIFKLYTYSLSLYCRRVLEKKLYRIFCFLDEDMDSYISKSAHYLCRDKLLDLARLTKPSLGIDKKRL